MTPDDRAAMEAQAAQYEAQAQAALEQSHQLHGAALGLRAWLAAHPAAPVPAPEPPPDA